MMPPVIPMLLLCALAAPAYAASNLPGSPAVVGAVRADVGLGLPPPRSPGRPHQQAGELTLDAAVEMVQRRYNAKVVRADVTSQGGARIYVLRLLSADGRVWTVRVDAATGSVSE
jgi:hypothetical protein